jgi:hypothetical protein
VKFEGYAFLGSVPADLETPSEKNVTWEQGDLNDNQELSSYPSPPPWRHNSSVKIVGEDEHPMWKPVEEELV